MTQPPRDHLAEIYIMGTTKSGKRNGLTLLCSRCGGPEIFANGLTVAAVVTAGNAHVARVAEDDEPCGTCQGRGCPECDPADHQARLAEEA